jgi:hypothetical protein
MTRRTATTRRRAPNDVIFHTASGGVLIAAGPPSPGRRIAGRLFPGRGLLPRRAVPSGADAAAAA